MGEEVKKDLKWILIVSVILFFWTYLQGLWTGFYVSRYITSWTYLRNVNILFFILTIIFATLYTADFWRKEKIYKAAIGFFIISMILFFILHVQWIFYLF
jgi:hypothetical protein